MSCPKGALPSIRHDRVRDMTAQLLTEVCPNVAVEPTHQPLTGERFSLRSTNIEDEARLDIKAQEFWNKNGSSTFFAVRVFNPYASSNNKSTAAACYRKHEMEKRRKYERRVLDVEHGSFIYTPGLLHEWRMGPFCILKAGQPHLQQGVTTLQCNSWLHPLQDCILTDRPSCDVPPLGQILHLQPLQGLESQQPATGPHHQ